LAVAIYANFFANHVLPDIRWILIPGVVVVFWRTVVRFAVAGRRLQMPMWLAFLLMGFFVWVAENVGTYFSGWRYPHQAHAWQVVEVQKISSWALLVIVSFVLVAWLKSVKEGLRK
ncbi:MAG TPA: DUF817 family protein, partial [Fimbriimonadaceae bacterium]|nr:DUF817 family protein [Fimbriimonadaceae bacterium]